VRDLARVAAGQASNSISEIVDTIGPETYTYRELAKLTAAAVGRDVTIVSFPPWLTIFAGKAVGLLVNDVILTANELQGLMNNYLTSQQAPNGETRFSDWIQQNSQSLGSVYSSELDRHFRWQEGEERESRQGKRQ
jgi:NADH dehydrogenase